MTKSESIEFVKAEADHAHDKNELTPQFAADLVGRVLDGMVDKSDVLKAVDALQPKDVIDGDLSLAGEVMASAILQRVRELVRRRIEAIQSREE